MAKKVGSLVVDMRANTTNFSRGVGRAKKEANSLKRSLGGLKTGLLALGGAFAFKQLVNQINLYTELRNQLKLVTKGSSELVKVQKVLFDAAQETRGTLEGTVKLYSRLARSTGNLGLKQKDLVSLTKLINKTLVISGASTQEASAAILQLGQGFASGVLRGQELNSVMEQTPRLARAMADGLGVGIGQLREMGKAGKLTSEVVVKALQTQSAIIDQEFGKTEKTIAQALTGIENEFLKTFGSAKGGSLVQSLDEFRSIISDPKVSEGLTAIATGIIKIGSVIAATLGNLAEFGTLIGNALAPKAGTTLENIKERIAETGFKIAAANLQIERAQGNVTAKTIRATEALKLLNEEQKLNIKIQRDLLQQTTVGGDTSLADSLKKTKPIKKETVGSNEAIIAARNFTLEQLANRWNEERKIERESLLISKKLRDQDLQDQKKRDEDAAHNREQILNRSTRNAITIFRTASRLYKGEGKKRNEESKTLAKVAIGISTAVAIMSAAETKPFYPLGLSMTIKAALLGAQQLQAIGASGGSSVTGGAGIASVTPTDPAISVSNNPQGPQTATQIIFTGDNYEGSVFSERIVEIIQNATNDRDIVVFNSDSRQAQEVRDLI